jgi:hypothetical protein
VRQVRDDSLVCVTGIHIWRVAGSAFGNGLPFLESHPDLVMVSELLRFFDARVVC